MRFRLALLIAFLGGFVVPALSQVPNVRVRDYPRDSIILLWDRVPGADKYRVTAVNQANATDRKEKWVVGLANGTHAAQLQVLSGTKRYKLTIEAWSATALIGSAWTQRDCYPKGTYEASLKTLTDRGGFFYDPKYDLPHMAPSCCLFKTTMRPTPKPNDPNSEYWTHYGAYLNDQLHWHQFLSDNGTGHLTMRVKQPISLGVRWPVTVLLDNDCGPTGRQAFYIFLSTSKQDVVDINPQDDNIPMTPLGQEIRLQGGSDGANGGVVHASYWNAGTRHSKVMVNRGWAWTNVRQIMGFKLWQDRIELLIDRQYDGEAEVVHTIPADLTQWPRDVWLYMTLGSYNQLKQNNMHGRRAGDKKQIGQYFHGGLWHLGQVAHDGSLNKMDLTTSCDCTLETGHEGSLATMPTHAEFAKWSVPTVKLTYPRTYAAHRVSSPFNVVIDASASMSAHFTAETVLLKRLRLELDGKVIWQEYFTQKLVNVRRALSLNVENWTDGYHKLTAYAETVSGSEGYNHGSDIYFYNPDQFVLIHHAPPQTMLPTLSGSVTINRDAVMPITTRTPRTSLTDTPDEVSPMPVYAVHYGGHFGYNVVFQAGSPLVQCALQMQGYDGKWTTWYEPSLMTAVQKTETGWQCALSNEIVIYSWYRQDATGGLNWRFIARDCDGNETVHPFRWQYQTGITP